MPTASLTSLRQTYPSYPHWDEVESFVAGVRALDPLFVLLFGSVAKGDFTQHSDADVLVVLEGPVDWLDVYAFSQGMVQPVVKTRAELGQQLEAGEPFYHEMLEDGLLLCQSGPAYEELQALARQARQALGLVRTRTGWRWGGG